MKHWWRPERAGHGSSTQTSYELVPDAPVSCPVPGLARAGSATSTAGLRLVQQDPHHRSLRFRQVHPNRPIFSARVGLHYRVVGIREDNDIYWFWIGSHAQYDHLLSQL